MRSYLKQLDTEFRKYYETNKKTVSDQTT